MRIFMSAGEASGDMFGAALIQHLQQLRNSIQFEGLGGAMMAATGMKVIEDTSNWGAISITGALMKLPFAFVGYRKAKKVLSSGKPGVLVLIDFGYFNVRLLRFAKKIGWKALYFIPPGSWKKGKVGQDLVKFADEIVVPFPWNVSDYMSHGKPVHYFGHPLVELCQLPQERPSRENFIAVLPGSRSHELEVHLPLLSQSLPPDIPTVFVISPSNSLSQVEQRWRKLAPHRSGDTFQHGGARSVLQRAKIGVVASGTAALEAALCDCPMIVFYRLPQRMMLEAKIIGFKQPEYISLPNIILGRRVVPEFVQSGATVSHLSEGIKTLLTDEDSRLSQHDGFEEILEVIGAPTAIEESAKLILDLATRVPEPTL